MATNALIDEKSPYLRQHAHNPVDWLPWGEAAFRKAHDEDKPIFLSIGYSTCHWCHVMAHESFESEAVSELLNRDFVPIKVDREERPDVDRIYMLFVQASTGSGGWPMSVFLTPDLKPFFGGTYFPPDSRYGRPGFIDLLRHLATAWREDRQRILSTSDNVIDQLKAFTGVSHVQGDLDKELFEAGFAPFRRSFDARWGGFGGAPKFPRPAVLNYLLRIGNEEARDMVVSTAEHMALGGMHDHLGGGFHRYSVDERWFVSHFEKMLYDQAQLASSYLEVFQLTGDEAIAAVARGIFEYVMRDLTDAEGGFYSAEDADSARPENPEEHGEGAFYVWTQQEIESLLGPEAARVFVLRCGVEPEGNVDQDPHAEFTGRNILYQARTIDEVAAQTGLTAEKVKESLVNSAAILFAKREKRPRPHLDNKVLTAWNGLMISALAKGYAVLGEARYVNAAELAFAFIDSRMRNGSGELLRRYCDGEAAVPAFLDDYAFLAEAAVDLFEVTGRAGYLSRAIELAHAFSRFEDQAHGGFFSTEAGSSDLVLRVKDDYDGAEPSGNSVAADVLLRLAHLTDKQEFLASAEKSLRAFAPKLRAQPAIAPQMLCTLGRYFAEPEQVVIRCAASSDASDLLRKEWVQFRPYASVFALTDEAAGALKEAAPFLASLERRGRLTIYHCRNYACELPQIID